jgi:hypothetical protein
MSYLVSAIIWCVACYFSLDFPADVQYRLFQATTEQPTFLGLLCCISTFLIVCEMADTYRSIGDVPKGCLEALDLCSSADSHRKGKVFHTASTS